MFFFWFAKTPTGRFGLLLPRHVRNLACFIVRPQGESSLEREIVRRPLYVIFFGPDSWLGVATPCLQSSIKRAIQMIEWSHDYVFQRIQRQLSPPCCSQYICTEIYDPPKIDPKPHCTLDTIYLPASQRTPPYPGGQAQTNLFTRSLHDPPFWHGLLAHSFISERQIQVTVKTRFTDTGLIRTPHYYGQFSLSMAKESIYIFSKFNPLNTDTLLIRILSMPPSMSVWTRFDCTQIKVSSENKDPKQRGLS